jgi:hypothetical protein
MGPDIVFELYFILKKKTENPPGAIALTRILRDIASLEAAFVKKSTGALDPW